ncbi:hypothetical protein K470DRAFT_254648, partial [Piedraia hortae CBS 480.64]
MFAPVCAMTSLGGARSRSQLRGPPSDLIFRVCVAQRRRLPWGGCKGARQSRSTPCDSPTADVPCHNPPPQVAS